MSTLYCTRIALVLALCVAVLVAVPGSESKASQKKPNIVFVITDDQDQASWRRMSEVRKLAKEGLVFENSYVTTSQCCPSRSTLLTGKYAHNHLVTEQIAAWGGGYEKVKEVGLEKNALPTWMDDEYLTAYMGKYMNEYFEANSKPPGWDRWFAYTRGMANPNWYEVNENGTEKRYDRRMAETDYLARMGGSFAKNSTRYDKPFFLTLAPFTPHKPYFYPERYKDTYNHLEAPKYPNFQEKDKSDKPGLVAGYDAGDMRHYDAIYRDRMRGLLGVNDMIRRVRAELEKNGEWENTIMVFTSDNGYLTGEHDWEGKSVPYENSIRVPLVMAGPGIPKGESRKQIAANIDWAPTLADFAGVEPKTEVDGRSLVPVIRDGSTEWRKRLLIEAWGIFQFDAVREGEGRRDGYLFSEWRKTEYQPNPMSEHYDMRDDPYQLDGTGGEREGLSAKLAKLRECAGETCRRLED